MYIMINIHFYYNIYKFSLLCNFFFKIEKPSKIQNNMQWPAKTTILRFGSSKIKHYAYYICN